ncbi:hypothetical protein CR513_25712, partial [Mucuna pruriens]
MPILTGCPRVGMPTPRNNQQQKGTNRDRTHSNIQNRPYIEQAEAPPLVDQSGQTGPTSTIQKMTLPREEKLNLLEERLRVVKGTDSHGLDVIDLCLVLDM